jgi:hypothetical protein
MKNRGDGNIYCEQEHRTVRNVRTWDAYILRQTQFHTTYQLRMPKRASNYIMADDQKDFK